MGLWHHIAMEIHERPTAQCIGLYMYRRRIGASDGRAISALNGMVDEAGACGDIHYGLSFSSLKYQLWWLIRTRDTNKMRFIERTRREWMGTWYQQLTDLHQGVSMKMWDQSIGKNSFIWEKMTKSRFQACSHFLRHCWSRLRLFCSKFH